MLYMSMHVREIIQAYMNVCNKVLKTDVYLYLSKSIFSQIEHCLYLDLHLKLYVYIYKYVDLRISMFISIW